MHLIHKLEAESCEAINKLPGEGKLLIAVILRALQDLGTDNRYSEFGRYISASESAWDFINSDECKHICSLLGVEYAALLERASALLERSASFDAESYRRLKISELRRGK